MYSTPEAASNIGNKKRIKPEEYTEKIYTVIRDVLSPNLFYIKDNGKVLDTDLFFDLCITDIRALPWYMPELDIWFQKRKRKINKKKKYETKREVLVDFIRDYSKFFSQIDWISGSVQSLVNETLLKNSTP